MLRAFFLAFLLTQLIECTAILVVALWLFRFPIERYSNRRLLATCFLATSITLPILWFVLPRFFPDRLALGIYGEAFVFLVEACVYRFILPINWGPALLISLICNGLSSAAGLLIFG